MADLKEMREQFVPGKRRPWALDILPLIAERKELVIDLSWETHDKIIKAQYESHRTGNLQTDPEKGDYTFRGGLWDGVRLFNQNNRPPYSLSDFHAEQLQKQLDISGIKVRHYATVGTGHSADQVLNAFYLLDKEAEIHVFEVDPDKIAGAEYLLWKLGIGNERNKFQFHQGDATEILPEIAKQIGGFDLIDLHLVLQHLRGEAFGKFLEALIISLKQGGLVKINDLLLGRFGMHSNEDYLAVQKLTTDAENYLIGDGTLQRPSFLNIGWRWPKGHAWNSREELVKDVQYCVGDVLSICSDLEMNLSWQYVDANHSFLMGMRYLPPTLAAAMTAKTQALKNLKSGEADKFEILAEWAWKEGECFDKVLISPEFKQGYLGIMFPECAGIVFKKV